MQAMFNMSTLRTYDQQQSFQPLVNNRINQLLANCVPAADQDLFQVINVIDFLTVDELLKTEGLRRLSSSQVSSEVSAIIPSTFQPFSIRNPYINSRSSTVNGAIIYARSRHF